MLEPVVDRDTPVGQAGAAKRGACDIEAGCTGQLSSQVLAGLCLQLRTMSYAGRPCTSLCPEAVGVWRCPHAVPHPVCPHLRSQQLTAQASCIALRLQTAAFARIH